MSSRLTFDTLRTANFARLPHFKNAQGQTAHHDDWTLNDWMVALAGEVGEAANLLKKVKRGDVTLDQVVHKLADELADVQCYLDILAGRAGIDLGEATRIKWNIVSKRVRYDGIIASDGVFDGPRPKDAYEQTP